MSRWLLLAAALLLVPTAAHAEGSAPSGATTPTANEPPARESGQTPEEMAVASRLIAPCCWTQTLDVHQSNIAIQLRHEIRRRLAAGQTPDQIINVMVARYGKRILAVPKGSHLSTVATTMFGLVGLAGVIILFVVLKRRAGREQSPEAADNEAPSGDDAPSSDEWDERLDAELRDV